MKFDVIPSNKENTINDIKNDQMPGLNDVAVDSESLLNKVDRFKRVPLTEEEKNMSDEELAKKYNLSRFSLVDARNKGYVVPDMYKSKIRHNEVIENIQNNEKTIKIPLTEEEKKLTGKELGEKYNLSFNTGYTMKENGYRIEKNPNFISKKSIVDEKRLQNRRFIEEITNIEANSVETILGNPKEQEIIRSIVNEFDIYKYNDKNLIKQKKFKLLNGEELSFGDISILNKLIQLKVFRDNNGQLMMLKDDKYIPFRPTYFFGDQHRSLIFKGDPEQKKDERTTAISLELFSPAIFKKGIFKEEDFNKKVAGSAGYEISGPHERELSHNYPIAFLSNSISSAKYYIGREKFTGTNTKINHETVRVSILDDETGVVTDTINGKKIILYTFPLINKDEFEKQKEEIINRRNNQNKTDNINLNNYITKKADLKNYLITDYLPKNSNESEIDYVNRISRLSDTTYVLGSFRSFMSETGLAANNYLWREQLVLADALTSVKNKDKIVNFGKNYKKDGLRTFLSVEQGGNKMGDKILELGNPKKLPEDISRKIFKKYGEYIDAVNDVEGVIKKEYKLSPSQKLINKTKESLLIRGRDLLLSQNKKLSDGYFSEEKLIKSLENTKVGVDLFKNIFRIVKENNPETSFEDFAGLVPESITSRDQIEDEDVLKIDEIIDKNYQSEDLRRAVKESFHKALESNKTTLNLLRKDEEIIALDRIDQREDGTLYFGSFNVDPDYCSSKIGAAFFEATVLPLMKKEIVKADCSALQPIASYYIESGFVSNKLYDYKGEPSFSLESIPDKKFISKDLTKLQIIEASLKNEMIEGLIIKSASSQKEIIENNIPEGYILARYFFDKDTKKWFSVLEKTN